MWIAANREILSKNQKLTKKKKHKHSLLKLQIEAGAGRTPARNNSHSDELTAHIPKIKYFR
jgi:hypothetical protein